MRGKAQIYLWTVALAALLAYGAVPLIVKENQGAKNDAAQNLAPVVFYDEKNRETTLDDFRGRVVLVNLWATWCPPCVAELPSLDRLQEKMKGQKFIVVPISVESDRKKVASFMKLHGALNLGAYVDRVHDIQSKWIYAGIPTSYLLDARGNLIETIPMPAEWDKGSMLNKIQNAIDAEKPK